MIKEEIYLADILKQLQIKYLNMIEVYRLTKAIEENLAQDNRALAKESLVLRGQKMDKIAACDKEIELFLQQEKSGNINGYEFMKMLKSGGRENKYFKDECYKEIIDEIKKIHMVWKKTVEIDKSFSKRIVGKKSYYD